MASDTLLDVAHGRGIFVYYVLESAKQKWEAILSLKKCIPAQTSNITLDPDLDNILRQA